ncbi:MAG: hypothetical protein LIP01_04160 [Tannerellaceae bacterium]|nr:hypothetical protein [Tannerellaceae bacterium]
MYVYFGADKAFIAPADGNLTFDGGKMGVKEPVSPLGMQTVKKDTAKVNGTDFVNSLYMFDNDTDPTSASTLRGTRLVIGGKLEGFAETMYYPLDFRNVDEDERIRVTRNQKYKITVTSINSQGWTDPDEAANQATANMDYDVVEWTQTEDKEVYVEGVHYVSLNKKVVNVARDVGNRNRLYLSTSYSCRYINLEFNDGNVLEEVFDDDGNPGVAS